MVALTAVLVVALAQAPQPPQQITRIASDTVVWAGGVIRAWVDVDARSRNVSRTPPTTPRAT
jgi:hypothetical protein